MTWSGVRYPTFETPKSRDPNILGGDVRTGNVEIPHGSRKYSDKIIDGGIVFEDKQDKGRRQ